ncbi:serine aminopeptidase, s33 domain-containing protein [Ditylenchus destructor]|nr:serine aminopeptidase, s33 domain-containing protein [Ditylenchus destructor]
MMLRVLLLTLTLFSSLGFAASPVVLQRPISLDTGSGELFGSLLLPKSEEPVPVVLIIAGSGPTDRNGNSADGARNDSLKRLAWVLARHNIASVRYDKRGVAASLAATPDETQPDPGRLRRRRRGLGQTAQADKRLGPLIVLGHSEGALVAALAAPQLDPAGVVSLSGSARPVDQVIRQQLADHLPPALLRAATKFLITSRPAKWMRMCLARWKAFSDPVCSRI